jgi:hypothetical protein
MIGGCVVMVAAVVLFCVAFQSAGTDSVAYWLWALPLAFLGVFMTGSGMKSQRLAGEECEREAVRRIAANDVSYGDRGESHS